MSLNVQNEPKSKVFVFAAADMAHANCCCCILICKMSNYDRQMLSSETLLSCNPTLFTFTLQQAYLVSLPPRFCCRVISVCLFEALKGTRPLGATQARDGTRLLQVL